MAMFSSVKDTVVSTKIVAADGSGQFTDIQSAIDDLPAGGGVVYVKEGTYNLSEEISITSDNVALIGAGGATKLVTTGDVNTIKTNNVSNVHIEKLNISGGGGGFPTRAGVYFLDTTRSIVQDCWIHDKDNYSIVLDSGSTNTVTRCKLYNNSGSGVKGVSGEVNSLIIGNHIYNNVGYGVLVTRSRNIVRDNIVFQNEAEGIFLDGASNCLVIGNEVTENDYLNTASDSGIYIFALPGETSDRNIVMGNLCSNNDNYEIEIEGANCNKNLITGNNCYGTDHQGTILDNGTGTVLTDNIET